MTGQTVAHYHILEKLGEGGMGVVYKAFDAHLDRQVAIKVLPASLVSDPERKRRFVNEAKAASALNHPNIITIYDISSDQSTDLIAMEYVDGKTLSDMIPRQGLALGEALKIATQIAGGLAKAHAAGITHRDLKPSNIMVDVDGRVKILDFGLAKLTDCGNIDQQDATLTLQAHTVEGSILGTVAYMSPEQAESKPTDSRSDIFSFGSVLYEMSTGQRAFAGESPAAILGAVIHKHPKPLEEVRPGLPAELHRVIARCLRKDRGKRFQHADDLKVALEEIGEDLELGRVAPHPVQVSARRWTMLLLGTLFSGAVIGGALLWTGGTKPTRKPELVLTQLTRESGYMDNPAVSADGKLLAFTSDRSGEGLDIWVRQVNGGQPLRLSHHPGTNRAPAFSPDGTTVFFQSNRDGGGIYAVPTLGGDERVVLRAPVDAWALSPDGTAIAFNLRSHTGEEAPAYLATTTGGVSHRLETALREAIVVAWAADGRHILVSGTDSNLHAVPVGGGKTIPVLNRDGTPFQFDVLRDCLRWPEDRLLISRSGTALGAIDEYPLLRGQWKVGEAVRRLASFPGASVQFDRSRDGLIVLSSLVETTDIWSLPVDANSGTPRGAVGKLTDDPALDASPSLSADGTRMIFVSDRNGNPDLWLRDMKTGKDVQVAATPESELRARISPDGTKVAYQVRHPGSIYVREVSGGETRTVCQDCSNPGWTPDSRRVVYYTFNPIRYHTFELESGEHIDLLSHPKRSVQTVRFSPDGKWLSFHLLAGGGLDQIFVAPVRQGRAAPESEWIAVTEKGAMAHTWWSPDGNLLYFLTDGYRSIACQPLDPVTKRPRGSRRTVFDPPAGHTLSNPFYVGLSLTRDRLVFTMSATKGNLWKLEEQPHR